MERFFVRGKKKASKVLAGFLAALMVMTTVPYTAFESRAEGEPEPPAPPAVPAISSAEDILGDAVNFGIVAKGLKQIQHMQTNYAVNVFQNPDFVNNDPDLITAGVDGNVMIPFYAAYIPDDQKARLDNFEAKGADRKQVIFYTPNTSQVSIKSPSNITYYLISESQETIEGKVNAMIQHIAGDPADSTKPGKSKELSTYSTVNIADFEGQDQNQYVIDVTEKGQTVYITVPAGTAGFTNAMNSQGIDIVKKKDQVIVFNLILSILVDTFFTRK